MYVHSSKNEYYYNYSTSHGRVNRMKNAISSGTILESKLAKFYTVTRVKLQLDVQL